MNRVVAQFSSALDWGSRGRMGNANHFGKFILGIAAFTAPLLQKRPHLFDSISVCPSHEKPTPPLNLSNILDIVKQNYNIKYH